MSETADTTVPPLKIEVAPDIVEILGLNLYTNLPRILVEFVANAYDADSPSAKLTIDMEKIDSARKLLREQWKEAQADRQEALKEHAGQEAGSIGDDGGLQLEELALPSDLSIVIEDRGHGMSRAAMQQKFLRIGRKRRKAEKRGDRSPEGRPVMGRKGIGKLAGFGVAKRLEVFTRPKGQTFALRIALDYDKLIGHETTENVPVEEELIEDGAGLEPHGTRVVLSKLGYEPTGAKLDTIARRISKHFAIVKQGEFSICLNGQEIPRFTRQYAFAYPNPNLSVKKLVDGTIKVEDRQLSFRYRIRFTRRKRQLSAAERGVRIYARQRLASTPSLLDLGTGMHGFQNTHYLDGEVLADFIDEQRADYIASDRQDLRWDTPILTELRRFLTEEMKRACIDYQDTKESTLAERIRNDLFTRGAIDQADLPGHRRQIAFRIAAKLAAGSPAETEDEYYRDTLPIVVRGLGYGELMSAINEIARAAHPSFADTVNALAGLTAAEWDDYNKIVSGRLKGIGALRRLCEDVNFKDANNEDELHDLLKRNPWLIDPTFWSFLTSNVSEKTLSEQLTKHLGVGQHIPADYDKTIDSEVKALKSNLRPDLTFLLSNYTLQRVVIVELKAPNTPLHLDHLVQLERYMRRTGEYLAAKYKDRVLKVEGHLIGSRASGDQSKAEKVEALRYREENRSMGDSWRVFDINELLGRADDAHRELLEAYERAGNTIPASS